MVNPDLPQEILVEIFSYLPTKPVGKCKCLSKTWNTRLSTSQFINLHKTRKAHQECAIIISRYGSLYITTPLKDGVIQLADKWSEVFGSCNGLVLLLKRENDQMLFVLNPVTRQQVNIPNAPSYLPECVYGGDYLYGFGYDRSCDDYKIVKLSREEDTKERDATVEVYCMKTRVWINVGYSPFLYNAGLYKVMPFVNGAMHWFTLKYNVIDQIAAFDLATESFYGVFLPMEREPKSHVVDGLVVLGGCLGIIDCFDNGCADVWVMKEYGVVDSWVRFRIGENNMWSRELKSVRFIEMGLWVVYDSVVGIVKHLITGDFIGWNVFEDSLVSPEQDTFYS